MPLDDERRAAPVVPELLLELLRANRERFLTFVNWRSCRRLAARRDAEDILQAASINACERWTDYEQSRMALEAWFYRIILNVLFDDHDYQGRKRRDYRAEQPLPDRSSRQIVMGLRNAGTTPSEAVYRNELKQRIERVLGELPAAFQQIMVLIHFAELSGKQAAELIGITHELARQRYARARVCFRHLWKKHYGEEGFG